MNEGSPNGDPEDAVTPTVMAEERGGGGGKVSREAGRPRTAEAIVKGTDSASPEAAPSQRTLNSLTVYLIFAFQTACFPWCKLV